MKNLAAIAALFIFLVTIATMSCSSPDPVGSSMDMSMHKENPFFVRSSLPYQIPAFDQIDDAHFLPAFERGMDAQLEEVDAIVNSTGLPTFENTLVALESSGQLLDRVVTTFSNLTSADTNETMESIRAEVAPRLAAHADAILLNDALFARVHALFEERDTLGVELDPESLRLIDQYHADFVRAGAKLSVSDKERMQAINTELATLQTAFSQNVLNEVNESAVVVDTREELAGLSDSQITSAAEAANDRDLQGKFLLPLLNTSSQPLLSLLNNRQLRKRIMQTSLSRGIRGGQYDNRETITRIARLRAERASLLGYPNHAAYVLEEQTAKTVEAVNDRLSSLAPPAAANARREAAELQAMVDTSGGGGIELASWDWSYYAEQVRADRYSFDESELRPYFELSNVLENGVFFAANRLFGITFKIRLDLPVYHPDVQVWEVHDEDGSPLGLFLTDYYARPSKRGGAWMSSYVSQSFLLKTKPVIANHLNVTKPPEGEPTLLTFDEVETMFHEFGHTLHGLFSNVRYPYFTGTSVPRDFVEFPSQVNEMWATWPEVLKNYAVHHETGESMPAALLNKVLAAETFNQGFATTEYLAASLLDQAWHQLTADQVVGSENVVEFEEAVLEQAGVALEIIPPRYRSSYFSHIWSSGYSAGYYSYIWSEVLDADSVEWFKENGGLVRKNGRHFRESLLSKGGSQDAMVLFREFRGSEPSVGPLLARRGLN